MELGLKNLYADILKYHAEVWGIEITPTKIIITLFIPKVGVVIDEWSTDGP